MAPAVGGRDGNEKSDFGAGAGRALNLAAAADFFQSLPHVFQAVAATGPRGTAAGSKPLPLSRTIKVKPASSVASENGNFVRAGMLDDVVQRFLEGEKNIVAHFGGDGPVRQMQGHFQAAADVDGDKIFLREISEITGQAVQRVVLRIDGPDDFIHRTRQFARGAVDAVKLRGGLGGIFQFAVRGLAQAARCA